MKRLLLSITLTCVLFGSALAGEMPGVNPAPVQPPSGTQSSTVVTVLLTIISIVG
jgi:hypothetical protein